MHFLNLKKQQYHLFKITSSHRAFYFTNMFFAIINILLISYLKYILLLAIEDPLMIQTVAVICLVSVIRYFVQVRYFDF